MKLSSEDRSYICELGKFAVREILEDFVKKHGVRVVDVDIRPNGLFSTLLREHKEARISFKESRDGVLDDIWVGVCSRDYEGLAEKSGSSFILVADMKYCHLIVVPFNIVRWHNFSGGKGFTIKVKKERYRLSSGANLVVDDLAPILKKLL